MHKSITDVEATMERDGENVFFSVKQSTHNQNELIMKLKCFTCGVSAIFLAVFESCRNEFAD